MTTRKKIDPAVSAAAAAFGAMGGRAGRGSAKKRSPEFYQEIGRKGAIARHGKTRGKNKPKTRGK